jgi:hypothetical protein
VTDNIIDDLTEYLDQYSNEFSKSYPHYDYIVLFGNKVEGLLLHVTDEMLKCGDEISRGPPGLHPSVKKKMELTIQHLWVLRGKIRRQQKTERRGMLISRRRRQRSRSCSREDKSEKSRRQSD